MYESCPQHPSHSRSNSKKKLKQLQNSYENLKPIRKQQLNPLPEKRRKKGSQSPDDY